MANRRESLAVASSALLPFSGEGARRADEGLFDLPANKTGNAPSPQPSPAGGRGGCPASFIKDHLRHHAAALAD